MSLTGRRPNLLFFTTLVLCLVITGATVLQDGLLDTALQDNKLRLRLERVLHAAPAPADAGLLAALRAPAFGTDNPRVAWLGGYYVFSQTFSPAAAQSLWAMAPGYAAEMLDWHARVTPDKQEQLRVASAAAALMPDALPQRRAWVDALIANEQWAAAAGELDRLLAAWPDDADLNALRGRVEWRGGGSPAQAKAWLEQAMALEPGNLLAPHYLIEFYENNGKPGELETFLQQTLTTNIAPELEAEFYADLANLYIRQGDFAAALPTLNAALGHLPQDPWVNTVAGDYYFRQQIFERAAEHYAVAALIYEDPTLWIKLGESYAQLQDLPRAVQAYCHVLANDAANAEARERLVTLGTQCD